MTLKEFYDFRSELISAGILIPFKSPGLYRRCNISLPDVLLGKFNRFLPEFQRKEEFWYCLGRGYFPFSSDGLCEICHVGRKVFNVYSRSYTHTCENKNCREMFRLEKLRPAVKNKSPETKAESVRKAKNTKRERYGNENYNNPSKQQVTMKGKSQEELKAISDRNFSTRKGNIEKFEKENNCTLVSTLHELYGYGWYNGGKIKSILSSEDFILDGKNRYVKNSALEKIRKHFNTNLINTSKGEIGIVEFLLPLYSGEIVKNSFKVIPGRKQLDLYFPDKLFAIEYNGVYWHSVEFSEKNELKHQVKTRLCEEKGIFLLHVFEDLYEWKTEVFNSIILSALDLNPIVSFSNVEIRPVNHHDEEKFVADYSLKEYEISTDCFGIYYNCELLQLVSFYCNTILYWVKKPFVEVENGLVELLKFSQKKNIVYTLDRSVENLKEFLNIGFDITGELPPCGRKSLKLKGNFTLFDSGRYCLTFL